MSSQQALQNKAERMFKNMLLDILHDHRRPQNSTLSFEDYITNAAKKFIDWCIANVTKIERDDQNLDYYSGTVEGFPVLNLLSDKWVDTLMQNYVHQFLDENIRANNNLNNDIV